MKLLIKKRRKELKMKLVELARLSGIASNKLGLYERNQINPTVGSLVKIAKALKTGVGDLVDMSDETDTGKTA